MYQTVVDRSLLTRETRFNQNDYCVLHTEDRVNVGLHRDFAPLKTTSITVFGLCLAIKILPPLQVALDSKLAQQDPGKALGGCQDRPFERTRVR